MIPARDRQQSPSVLSMPAGNTLKTGYNASAGGMGLPSEKEIRYEKSRIHTH